MPATIDPRRDEAAWLADRRRRLTATDAAAIVGKHPYRTPLDVYLEKLGLAPDREPGEAAEWGLRLEGPILEAYSERTGREVVAAQQYVVHPAREWMAATLDAVARDRLVEVKTIGLRSRLLGELGEPGSDEVPTPWLIQVQHQMAVTGHDLADVAALLGGQELRIYEVRRNDTLIGRLVEREERFWAEHVLGQVPPGPSTAEDADNYQWLYPDRDGGVLWQDPEILALLDSYEAMGELARNTERKRKEIKAELLAALGDHARATTTDGRTVEAKKRQRSSYTVQASEYLDFRVKTTPGTLR